MKEYRLIMEKSFEVDRDIRDCFRYASDFTNLHEWDPSIKRSVKKTPGAVGTGTIFDVDLSLGLQTVAMIYTVSEFRENECAVLTGQAGNFTAIDTVTVRGAGNGMASVTWKAEITFRGAMAFIIPQIESTVRRNGYKAIDKLKEALEDKFEAPGLKLNNRAADTLILPGLWKFTRYGYYQAKRRFKPLSASAENKHIVLTGATSGIGLAAAHMLAEKGAHLTLVARDEARGESVRRAIVQRSGNPDIRIEIADLSLLSSTRELAERLLRKNEPVDVLINNAGALFNDRDLTVEGFEKSFALLLLSPFVLTEKLIPLMTGGGRVVNVSSGGMYSQRLDTEDLLNMGGLYNGAVAYAKAKRALVVLAEEWSEKYAHTGIVFNSMHPGWADTPGVESSLPSFYKSMRRLLRTPEQGADTIVWLAIASEAEKVTGKFFLDRQVHTTHMLPRTKESADDRVRLLKMLAGYAEKKTPVETA